MFDRVYIIYSADVVSDYEAFIERMSPRVHSPATAEAFTLTEGDDQYDYGYLADESSNDRLRAVADVDPESDEPQPNAGRHRKWVGELTREQWKQFAYDYMIDLDESYLPQDYNLTLGSITEHGHLGAIAVDNTEGWDDYSGSEVIKSEFYLSFGGVA